MALAMSSPNMTCDVLKVRVEETLTVYPSEATKRRTMFLSNIDQVMLFTVETVHFFAPNPRITSSEIVEMIRNGLSKVLVPYDFLAGRLQFNKEQGRLQIDCCAAGALFAVASTDIALTDLQDIAYPNPSFKQLLLQQHHTIHNLQDLPLCFLQVTQFRCGGFAIGLGTNHTILDGVAAVIFMKTLASLAASNDIAMTPFSDRSLLRARSPPLIQYSHEEFVKFHRDDQSSTIFTKVTGAQVPASVTSSSTHACTSKCYVFKLFRLSASFLRSLKMKATVKCSSFEAVTAHVWKCRTVAVEMQENEKSCILFAVDVRGRMNPPLPTEYAGNAVFPAYASANAIEVKEKPLSLSVKKVQEGIARVTDEYVRSAIDWMEVNKGIPRTEGAIFVSSWWRLGFEDVEYPWGKSVYYGPVVHEKVDIILLLPNNCDRNGLNVLLALPPHQMAKFEQLFQTHCS